MAIFYADGFDHYGTGATGLANMLKRNYLAVGTGPQATVKRTGVNSWSATDNTGSSARLALPSAKDVLGVALAVQVDALPTFEGLDNNPALVIMRCADTFNNQMCCVSIATTGALRLRNSAGTILASTAAGVIAANSQNHVEAKFTFAGASGEVEIRVNEAVIALDVINVNIGNAATCEQFGWNSAAGAHGFGNWYIDDLVLWDDTGADNNDFIGDCAVFCHMPNADTVSAQFTKSTGTVGYVIIDDIPPDADFITANVAGYRSDFEMPAFAVGNVAGVKAVQRFSLVRKGGAGSATFQQGVKSAGTDGDGAVYAPTTGDLYYNDVFNRDPDGSTAWDVAAVEDMEIYVKKVA